ncbi:MAG: YidC/Oxa1 family membrane protein insertase [Acidimicrobiia bacterium]
MSQIFDILKQALGSVLAFFYDVFDGVVSEGLALGFAIIFLTVFINVLVFPLTLKQTRATRAFTALQPEIKRIQKEYKDDPQEMQKRLMEAQKSAGATPGGCLLPLLVQMPIWFALFRVLQTPLIRDANGVLVEGAAHPINPLSSLGMALLDGIDKLFLGMDLSQSPAQAMSDSFYTAIPYLIMIVLMVATQFVQQWHSTYGQEKPAGQPGAGAQQAITKIMPLFIGFISWNFPAGLVLYWTTSNLFRLGQQALIFRIDGRPSPVAKDNSEPKQLESSEGGDPVKKPQASAASKRRRRRRR